MTTVLGARLQLSQSVVADPPVVLAPMAGITNTAFRRLCREFGAGLYVSEMITTRALVERNAETMRLIGRHESEKYHSVQLYTTDPQTVGDAVRIIVAEGLAFPNGMVDRITPATGDRERKLIADAFGIDDKWPVFCEGFKQWVLEDKFPLGRPALATATIFTFLATWDEYAWALTSITTPENQTLPIAIALMQGPKGTQWGLVFAASMLAIVPVIVVTALYGERGTGQLLVFSQVVLSMQLPFAVIPLVRFVSDRRKMGHFAISRPLAAAAWIVAGTIVVLNVKLLFDTLFG